MMASRFCVVNLGCKVNRVESDAFEAQLERAGGIRSKEADADLIIVNTCTVTGEAEKKTRKAVRHCLTHNDHAPVIVTGCASAIDPDEFTRMDDRVRVVPKALMADEIGLAMLSDTARDLIPASSPGHTRARVGIKTQDGCNNACTYCIVHVARGNAISMPWESIVDQAIALAQDGIREIVLTGINLGSYHDRGVTLADLCVKLLTATQDIHGEGELPCRFRVSSIEPTDVSPEFIQVLARSNGRICRHLHIPLQAGSSKVLKEMNRPYSAEFFAALVAELRRQIPDISLSTDIIVGFPGETEEEFQDTLALARACAFSKIHVFPYSKRVGTPAAARPDQVDPLVKTQRAARLRALSDELAEQDRSNRSGKPELVLVESPGSGMSESYHRVRVGADAPVGSLVFHVL